MSQNEAGIVKLPSTRKKTKENGFLIYHYVALKPFFMISITGDSRFASILG